MRILADSNLLIAGLIRSHVHHAAVSPWMQAIRAKRVELVLAAHSVAETFSVMTRGPFQPAMTPAEVWGLIQENILPFADIQTLTHAEYLATLARLAAHGLGGGLVYDGLIAQVAERAGVDLLLTFNTKHYIRLPSGGNLRVESPLNIQPPSN